MNFRSMNWPTARNKEPEEVLEPLRIDDPDDEESNAIILLSKLVLSGTEVGDLRPASQVDKLSLVQAKEQRSGRGSRREPTNTGLVPTSTFPAFMTTTQAAKYCAFKTSGGIRKAHRDGRIVPCGRRGGAGTWIWAREECDRFLRGEPIGQGQDVEAPPTPARKGAGATAATQRSDVSDEDRARARRAMRNAGMVVKGDR